MDFHLFGDVKAVVNGRNVPLGSEKERRLVAALLLSKGRPIARRELFGWLWDEGEESRSAVNDLEGYMAKLRNRLGDLGLRDRLVAQNGLVQLNIPPDLVDVHRFRAAVAQARGLSDGEAAQRLRHALELAEGQPLAGLNGLRADAHRQALVEERRYAELEYLRLEVKQGRYRPHLPTLTRWHVEEPDQAEVAGLAMYALYRVGRQQDALAVYQRHRECLADQGLEVSRQIRELQTRILNEDGGSDVDGPPFPEPDGTATPDPQDPVPPRVPVSRTRVINKIRGPVTGENVVFGVQNQVRP